MKRTNVINYLVKRMGHNKYLEIGVRNPEHNFNRIKCQYKEGVDPNPISKAKYVMTSDEFFKKISKDKMYDCIFIDGLHEYKQTMRDIKNSLEHLSIGGSIILHDCNPCKRGCQEKSSKSKKRPLKWNGTVWKAFADLRMSREDLCMYVVNIDNGCGVVRRGHQKLFNKVPEKKMTYDFLKKNRKELLKLCSFNKFRKRVNELCDKG